MVTTLEITLIAIGLAMDAAAVSIAAAAAGYANQRRQVFRLAFHFGLFQAFMPLLGWLAGSTVVAYMEHWDHWIAFTLLAIVGGHMIYSGLQKDEARIIRDPTRGWILVTLSLATSIDALAVGLSLSMLNTGILLPCLLIGLITSGLSVLAIRLGRSAGAMLGQKVEILGGLILIGIGLRILISHLWISRL